MSTAPAAAEKMSTHSSHTETTHHEAGEHLDLEKAAAQSADHDHQHKPGEAQTGEALAGEKAAPPASTGYSVPDGGLQAYLNILGAWLILGATFGYVSSFGVFQSYYAFHLFPNKSSSDISWLGSVQLFFQFALGAVSGPLMDAGYFHYVVGAGSALLVFCLFMLSLCKQYWQVFLAQAIGIGIANGLLFLPAVSSSI